MSVLLSTIRNWYCPNCKRTEQTEEARPHSRFHVCPKLANLTAPMLPAGTAAKVERRDREDYVGRDIVQVDGNKRPVMSIVTTRDNGNDVVVFAPLAGGQDGRRGKRTGRGVGRDDLRHGSRRPRVTPGRS